MKNRSREQIYAEILEFCVGEWPKLSRIMRHVNLTTELAKRSIEVLIMNGLLEYSEVSRTYRTTVRGSTFLQVQSQMGELDSPYAEGV